MPVLLDDTFRGVFELLGSGFDSGGGGDDDGRGDAAAEGGVIIRGVTADGGECEGGVGVEGCEGDDEWEYEAEGCEGGEGVGGAKAMKTGQGGCLG